MRATVSKQIAKQEEKSACKALQAMMLTWLP
jgi:hypothetical protein